MGRKKIGFLKSLRYVEYRINLGAQTRTWFRGFGVVFKRDSLVIDEYFTEVVVA